MSTKARIQKVRAEVEAHEERGWLKGYEEGLAKREQQIVDLQNALEARNERIGELSRQKKGLTTARGALALAWELAHPVNSGDVIPKGMTCLKDNGDCITTVDHPTDWTPMFPENIRTLDPLPDPLPDWLDAPAVQARPEDDTWIAVWQLCTAPWCSETEHSESRWVSHRGGAGCRSWRELRDVTPLYPKQDA